MAGGTDGPAQAATHSARLQVRLLGPFSVKLGPACAGPWGRPSAKRLCELLMLSPGRRLGREVAREVLFGHLAPSASANSLAKALSLARDALAPLGPQGWALLQADRAHIWVSPEAGIDIDLVDHERALRAALGMAAGSERDAALFAALAGGGTLLEDEPYADWAIRPREALEMLRQRARLELARDRSRGYGRAEPASVVDAWEDCLVAEPASEEAASSLVRIYSARGSRQLALSVYERCRAALAAEGATVSPLLERSRAAIGDLSSLPPSRRPSLPSGPPSARDERRLVTILHAELVLSSNTGGDGALEEVRRSVSAATAALIAEVEGLGGTVISVSGAGLVGLFGAPEGHEDDPERAVRAGSRALALVSHDRDAGEQLVSVRVGIETGPAVVGPLWSGLRSEYVAVGEVVQTAAALQSAARRGSVLVGPATRAATGDTFEWGATEVVPLATGAKLLTAAYLSRLKAPTPRASARAGPRMSARLVGRDAEVRALDEAVRQTTMGKGSVLFIVAEPGLGKTRLVRECRERFMAWVGAGTGRLPLWLEGRSASFASSTPYGLYQQLLAAWMGVATDAPEALVRPALERAMRAVFGGEVDHTVFVAEMMGLRAGSQTSPMARLSPEGLQRATFASMTAVLRRLVASGPTVLALEDLHWADPVSLRLTEEVARLTSEGPLLLVLTRRPEPDHGTSELETVLRSNPAYGFRGLELRPLGEEAERDLACSVLGEDATEAVVSAVRRKAEGNPLFLEERFLSLVETGALVQHEGSWSLGRELPEEPVPSVLERLVRSRVDRLSPPARETVVVASVLGPEFSLPMLGSVAETHDGLPAAVAELCSSGVLVQDLHEAGVAFRFRHALIQEAIYAGLLPSRRSQLHARAAWALEESSSERLTEVAAVLGHHYAMAGEYERAVHHLQLAADHAVAKFATGEAVASYRKAIRIVDSDMRTPGRVGLAIELRAKLAHVLWRTTRLAEAREVLHEAIGLLGPEQPLRAARLQARLGRVEAESYIHGGGDQCHLAALAAFDAVEDLLGEYRKEWPEDWVDTWLEVLIDGRANLHHWRSEPERKRAALARARPIAETRGSYQRQAALFFHLASHRNFDRRQGSEQTIALMRKSLAFAEQGADQSDLAICLIGLGEELLRGGELAEAKEKLQMGLAAAERVGSGENRAWCLSYLCLLHARLEDVEAVRSLSGQVRTALAGTGMPLWRVVARAAETWLAWKDGKALEVVRLAGDAKDLSISLRGLARSSTSEFDGLWSWPLISVHLGSGELAAAIDAARWFVESRLMAPQGDVEPLLRAAVEAWDGHDAATAATNLHKALEQASEQRLW